MTRYIAFCKIIECGSFTRAAEALGYTQAAVSQMIRSLEKEHALTLLIRTRSGVRLTCEGEKLYPLIRKYVSVHRELTECVGELHGLADVIGVQFVTIVGSEHTIFLHLINIL